VAGLIQITQNYILGSSHSGVDKSYLFAIYEIAIDKPGKLLAGRIRYIERDF